MPQISTTTSGPNYDTTAFTNLANSLLTATAVGQPTNASNWEQLRSLLNTWVSHTHTVTDQLYIAFGNTNAYATTSVTATTSSCGATGESHAEVAGNDVTASWVNDLISRINGIRTHSHPITDQSLP